MKKGLVIGIVAVVILLVIVFVGLKINSPSGNSQNAINDNSQQVQDNVQVSGNSNQLPSEESSAKTYNAEISGFVFSPQVLSVKVGDTVTWTNKDSAKHTVTSDSGNELNSNLLGKNEEYSHTFTTAGTYKYHCTPHPYKTGKIVVE